MLTATLFDFNGVLVDDEHLHLEAFREVLLPFGISLDDATYAERYLGFDDRGAFAAILADNGRLESPAHAQIDALVAAKEPVYFALAKTGLRIFPGAEEIVRRRARLGPVGIVSGALRSEITWALAQLGVSRDVAFIVSAERTNACKPDPEGYLLALRELESQGYSTSPHDRRDPGALSGIVVIEDSLAGVDAAKRASLRCVAVGHSYGKGQLLRAGADAFVATLADADDLTLDGPGERARSTDSTHRGLFGPGVNGKG